MDTNGPLTDDAFYRLVACAAPPNGKCTKPFYRWEKTNITVGIVTSAHAFLGGKKKRAEASVVRALQHLNAVEMAIKLLPDNSNPDIAIHLLDTPRGARIELAHDSALNGQEMGNAIGVLDVDMATITGANIAFSNTITIRQYESVMLEEIIQALGLITDIQNPHYQSRSILSQNANNSLKSLGEQDKLALIRHYPPN